MSQDKAQYKIIRTDLFPTEADLEKLLDSYKQAGLDVKEEIKKLIALGYIK